MKRAILLLAALAGCGAIGCSPQAKSKLVLTFLVNSAISHHTSDEANAVEVTDADAEVVEEVVATRDKAPAILAPRPLNIDDLVAALWEVGQLHTESGQTDTQLATGLNDLIDRISKFVNKFEGQASASTVLAQQVRDAQAIALDRAAALLPAEFAGRLDDYSQATYGFAWDRKWAETQAINRLISSYLVAAEVPSDVAHVLELHSATFPHHPMNVELYSTIAERLVGVGDLVAGTELARAGLRNCAQHSEIKRLQERVNRIYGEHPGEIGVPMNFSGPTLRENWFVLNSLQGKPVLVVFWATPISKASEFMASCVDLSERYAATQVEVVGVSLDKKLSDVTSWVAEQTVPCRQVFSAQEGHAGLSNPIAQYYGVKLLPAFFLLDENGIVIARGTDELEVIEQELRRLGTPRLALSGR